MAGGIQVLWLVIMNKEVNKQQKANAVLQSTIYFYKGNDRYQLLLISNKALKKQILNNDWILDVFLTSTEKAYIYRKGRMVERIGARIAGKLAYSIFSPYVNYQQVAILNDNMERPSLYENGTRFENISVSLSHTQNYSGAMISRV